MINNLCELKEFIKKTNKEDISFSPYFHLKKEERPEITEELIRNNIIELDNILGFQKQIVNKKERYRIGIKLKGLNIITSWKTSRKWQKAIQK